jgi:hypothetical protein
MTGRNAFIMASLFSSVMWTQAHANTVADCRREYLAEKTPDDTTADDEARFVRSCLISKKSAKQFPSSAVPPRPDSSPMQSAAREAVSNDSASKESENPVTRWITAPLRYEGEFFDGPYKLTKDTFELDQAILPFQLSDDWALITRTKLPLVLQPPKTSGAQWSTGLSNGYTTFFLSPELGEGNLYWGAGPVLYYPASSTTLGVDQWGSGPSVAFVVKNSGPWVFGVVANNIWSFGGGPLSGRTNQMLLNPFISYHLGDGWAVGSSPDIAADWFANGGKWTVPVGGGLSKTVRIGDAESLKLSVDAYYNTVRPKADQETWLVEVTATLLFPR